MIKNIFKILLPRFIVRNLTLFKNVLFDSYAEKSYSQEGEDMILRRIFEHQECGFYVDVGAHHPKRFSNTYRFYKVGWRGINIDAMPGSMAAFNKVRRRDINVEQPISSSKEVLTYYGFNEPALNGFSERISNERDGKSHYKVIFRKELETTTLDSVLDEYLPNTVKKIDFLSIDVEGLDFEVLKSISLDRYSPKVILVEVLSSSLSDLVSHEIVRYLSAYDYEIYSKAVNTVIFRDKTLKLRK